MNLAELAANGSIGLQELLIIVVPVAVALLLLALALNDGPQRKQQKRLLARVTGDSKKLASLAPQSVDVRRKQANSRLPGLENMVSQALPKKELLLKRIERSGLRMTLSTYLLLCVISGGAVIAGAMLSGIVPLPAAILGGVAAGFMLPHLFLALLIKRRQARFIANFPEAIDLMTRGLKSGLPIVESMKTAGEEVPDPVGKELRDVTDSVRLGGKIEDALSDASERLSLQEFRFFTISLSIQSETGGNLTETLQNLAEVLRKRRQLKLKINALSSEAKASAYIIGSLPFVMAAIIYMINPGYISQLVIDPRGHVLIGLGLGSFGIGALVMFKMVRFDY